MVSLGVIFSFGSAKVFSPAIIETCFSYDKDKLIAITDYYMHFYLIGLFLKVVFILLKIYFKILKYHMIKLKSYQYYIERGIV